MGLYGVSKAGLHSLLMLYGAELASECIVVASTNPGMVETDGVRQVFERMGESAQTTILQIAETLLSTTIYAKSIIQAIDDLTLERIGNVLGVDGSIMPF